MLGWKSVALSARAKALKFGKKKLAQGFLRTASQRSRSSKPMPNSTSTLFLLYHILCGIGKSANTCDCTIKVHLRARHEVLNLGRKRGEA